MSLLNENIRQVTAFAPATCANVAVGFDILGFAIGQVGDYVTLTAREDDQFLIEAIHSSEPLPLATDKNTASVVVKALCRDLGIKNGFSIQLRKGIPLSSGMGGSAACAVAALVALNAFLKSPLTNYELAQYALLGEEVASGQPHADNVVPCLFGGMTLIRGIAPIAVVSLPIPKLYVIIVHPHLHVATKDARKVLSKHVLLTDHVKQSANLATFIASLYEKNDELLQQSLVDIVIEPQRAQFVPGFKNIKDKALRSGALAVSFSGSGPSLFAFAKTEALAEQVCQSMCDEFQKQNVKTDYWISPMTHEAARVIEKA